MKKTKLLNRKQYDKWIKGLPSDHCVFCDWQGSQLILKEFENWVWIANIAPYWRYHTMIIPKRHFVEYEDQSFKEAGELLSILHFTKKKLLDAGLVHPNGSKIDRIIHFWRYRESRDETKVEHFHLQVVPDLENSWNPIIDKKAYKSDISKLL